MSRTISTSRSSYDPNDETVNNVTSTIDNRSSTRSTALVHPDRVTTAERLALAPPLGDIVFDIDLNANFTWNGIAWKELASASGGGSTDPEGSNGEIQFNNNGVFGASPNMHWDDTNERLGIGQPTPTEVLEVVGNVKATTFIGSGESLLNNCASNVSIEPTGADIVRNVVSLTQAEYDAGSPNSSTFYLITDAV